MTVICTYVCMYILDEESKVSAGVRKGNENPHANLNQSKN